MRRLKRREEGVSPVIATILMVAITVVLAATLYMMVGDFGDDPASFLAGNMTHREGTQFEFTALEQPSSAPLRDVQITVIDTDGDEESWPGDDSSRVEWSVLDSDGEVVAGSRFNISGFDSVDSVEDIDEIVVRIDGYDGMINKEM